MHNALVKPDVNEAEQGPATPWVSAQELQPPMREDTVLDEVDEACMESFPCSDPPCYSHGHA